MPKANPLTTEKLLTAQEAASMCSVSVRTWWRYDAAGVIPKAITLGLAGKTKRWRRGELVEWMAAGVPCRTDWEQTRQG